MFEIGKRVCAEEGGNTGFSSCVLNFRNIVGAILSPRPIVITPEDAEDLKAFLKEKTLANNSRERAYPIPGFEEITDNTEEPIIETVGYGGKNKVRDGDYDWSFRYVRGGMCLSNGLRRWNNTYPYVMFIDADGVLFGTKQGDNLVSVPLTLYDAPPWRPNTGSESTIYAVQFSFRPHFINEDKEFIDTGSIGFFSDIVGLQNVNLKVLDPENAPVTKVKAFAGCDKSDLFDDFEDELESTELWTAINASGEELDIVTVVADPVTKSWTITVDDAGETYFINLAGPTELDAAGVSGYEGRRVMVEVTPT